MLKVLRPGLFGSGEALALPNLKSVLGLGRELLAALLAVVVVRDLVGQVVGHLDDVPGRPRVRVLEDEVDLLERPSSGLGEEDEDRDGDYEVCSGEDGAA